MVYYLCRVHLTGPFAGARPSASIVPAWSAKSNADISANDGVIGCRGRAGSSHSAAAPENRIGAEELRLGENSRTRRASASARLNV